MRVNYLLPVSMILILLLPIVIAESKQVDLSLESSIAEYDVGISTGALSPDGKSVLLVGNEGYVHLVSAKNAGDRSLDIELNSARDNDFNDISLAS